MAKKDYPTIRTTLVIDDWGPAKNEDEKEMLMEHILHQLKEGYTSGHEDKLYWQLKENTIS